MAVNGRRPCKTNAIWGCLISTYLKLAYRKLAVKRHVTAQSSDLQKARLTVSVCNVLRLN